MLIKLEHKVTGFRLFLGVDLNRDSCLVRVGG